MEAEQTVLNHPPKTEARTPKDEITISLDAFVRSIGVRRTSPFALFLGAGASTTSGVPSAQMCIWDWKRRIFLTNNPGLEEQFAELSLDGVRRRIQRWLDARGNYPREDLPEEYGFYINECFPIEQDRRAFFSDKILNAVPHVGYRLLCLLAQSDLVRSVFSTNFDGLPARAAANFKLKPLEIGIDTQNRAGRKPERSELLCVSMHGDYRYDRLKNTPGELQAQEAALRSALIDQLQNTTLVVAGYSGRDHSVMAALRDAYTSPGTGTLYWCGFGEGAVPQHIAELIAHARAHGRQAYYVPTLGFDDLMSRVGLHCLEGEARADALRAMEELAPADKLVREPWQVPGFRASTLIKSNAFALECPSEMLRFDLVQWPPKGQVWTQLKELTGGRQIVAVPFKGKIFAFGTIDDVKQVFATNIKGDIERTPVGPKDLNYDDGAITSLMRETLTRAMAASAAGICTDNRGEIWRDAPREDRRGCKPGYRAHDSVQLYLRRIGGTLYLVLKPSIKVLTTSGGEAPIEVAKTTKVAILGYQHNKPFNQAVNAWRETLLGDNAEAAFEYPANCGSSFRFKVRRSPVFGEIGLPQGGPALSVPDKLRPLVKHSGIQLGEPDLLFSNKAGSGLIRSPHPVRGLLENRPYDYALTSRGIATNLRIGVICAAPEAQNLRKYLQQGNAKLAPAQSERDYLVDYPGFQTAYGVSLDLPDPGSAGWHVCPEPSGRDPQSCALEIAAQINRGLEALQSSFAPHVVLVFYPNRWAAYKRYRTEFERFDVHDFVKAFAVQRGIATQFFNEETFSDGQQARVWWWLSLALYAKAMRTPWVLDTLAADTAFVGLGFSVDHTAEKGRKVVLGCSHIYSGKGEGLQYRLTKVEDPFFIGKNPFMSRDDARRTGETIRQLFFDARFKLPDRVVLHKTTAFTSDEQAGLADGLSGVKHIDMLEVQIDSALRYVASIPNRNGSFDDDNYPVRRGTAMKLDDYTALLWVHGATNALNPNAKYFQGKRRIPAPLTIRRHAGRSDLVTVAQEILGLSKMNWNTFDLYTKLPATLHSSGQIAKIGSLLQRIGAASYDYRLFM